MDWIRASIDKSGDKLRQSYKTMLGISHVSTAISYDSMRFILTKLAFNDYFDIVLKEDKTIKFRTVKNEDLITLLDDFMYHVLRNEATTVNLCAVYKHGNFYCIVYQHK